MASELVRNINRAAAIHHTETADTLTALRDRLGRDGLSVEEWNGLIHAIHDQRLDADRRARFDFNVISWQTPVRLYSVEWNSGMIESRMFGTVEEARAETNQLIARFGSPVTITPVEANVLNAEALCRILNRQDPDGLDWLTGEAETYTADRPAP